MKLSQCLAALVAFAISFSIQAQAVCPVQQTTVFFVNGVDTEKEGMGSAEESKQRLGEELLKRPGVTKDCVEMNLAYNTNEPFFLDLFEAIVQKTAENTGVDNFPWGKWLRAESTAEWFESFVLDAIFTPARALIASGRWVLGDQRDEHVLAYQAELQQGRRVILAAHSQGSINATEERTTMSPLEQESVDIVAAAAFSLPEPDPSRYTTIDRDNLTVSGGGIFTTPDPNIFLDVSNFLLCDPATPSPFYCHAFVKSYMAIQPSREKIVDDIVALLPMAPPPGNTPTTLSGLVRRSGVLDPVPGVRIVVCRIAAETDQSCGTILTETTSGSNGRYQTTSFSECTPCAVEASVMIGDSLYTAFQTITSLPAGSGNVTEDVTVVPTEVSLGTVEGFVRRFDCIGSGTGVIAPNTTVRASQRESSGQFTLVAETTSDSSGFYRLSLPPGTYFISGGEEVTTEFRGVTVSAGQTVQNEVRIGGFCD